MMKQSIVKASTQLVQSSDEDTYSSPDLVRPSKIQIQGSLTDENPRGFLHVNLSSWSHDVHREEDNCRSSNTCPKHSNSPSPFHNMNKDIWSSKLCEEIVKYELIEEESLQVLTKLCGSLTLERITVDMMTATFSLQLPHSLLPQGYIDREDSKLYLHLKVIKGSLFTTIWHMFARHDDEYELTVDIPQLVMMPSIISSTPSYFIDYQSNILWRVKGMDATNAATYGGEVYWNTIKHIMSLLEVNSIGVLSFTKLLSRVLITLPLFAKSGCYDSPMPLSYMSNFVNVVACSPLELHVSSNELTLLQQELHVPDTFLTEGSALWIKGYYPYWTTGGSKALCKREMVVKEYVPVGSTDIFDDSAVRIVEICHHPLGKYHQLVAVVELVHRKRWMEILRFAVLDVDKLFTVLLSDGESLDQSNSNLQEYGIPLYDELEFYGMCNKKLREDQKANIYLVDFRNCCTWGAPVK